MQKLAVYAGLAAISSVLTVGTGAIAALQPTTGKAVSLVQDGVTVARNGDHDGGGHDGGSGHNDRGRGSDDGAGHDDHGRGNDDGVTHIRHGHGADDAAGDDRGGLRS